MNTRPPRSLFREFRLINWLTRKVLLHTYILLSGVAVRIVRAAVLFFIDAGAVVWKNGAFMRFERERKNGRRVGKREVAEKRKCILRSHRARIVRAAGSLFIVAEGSPLSIIQRLLREARCSCWNIRVFKAVRMKDRRVVTG